jgi:hypothetical protein
MRPNLAVASDSPTLEAGSVLPNLAVASDSPTLEAGSVLPNLAVASVDRRRRQVR